MGFLYWRSTESRKARAGEGKGSFRPGVLNWSHHDSNESTPHTPHVEFKLSPRIPRAFSRKVSFTAPFWGCCYEPEIGPLSPSQIRSSTLHSHLSGLRMANMVQDQNILHGLRTSENWSRHRSRQDIQTSAQVIACAQKYDLMHSEHPCNGTLWNYGKLGKITKIYYQ